MGLGITQHHLCDPVGLEIDPASARMPFRQGRRQGRQGQGIRQPRGKGCRGSRTHPPGRTVTGGFGAEPRRRHGSPRVEYSSAGSLLCGSTLGEVKGSARRVNLRIRWLRATGDGSSTRDARAQDFLLTNWLSVLSSKRRVCGCLSATLSIRRRATGLS